MLRNDFKYDEGQDANEGLISLPEWTSLLLIQFDNLTDGLPRARA